MPEKITMSPFLWGVIGGLITGNLSLGIVTAGFVVLLYGYHKSSIFIILGTIFTVVLSGNINFEIILVYYITVVYLVENNRIFVLGSKKKNYLAAGFLSLLLIPLWTQVFGNIPVQVLNDFNIAGITLLQAGIVLSLRRGQELLNYNNFDSLPVLGFILGYILSILGIYGSYLVIPVWLGGLILYAIITESSRRVYWPPFVLSLLIFLISLVAVIVIIPLNIAFVFSLLVVLVYYFQKGDFVFLEVIYGSVFWGLFLASLGLIK
ncbi:MAG: hypothetical protein ACOCQ1_02190 [Halanaerobiaceae bacterium]